MQIAMHENTQSTLEFENLELAILLLYNHLAQTQLNHFHEILACSS
jgi:hypothetical protein